MLCLRVVSLSFPNSAPLSPPVFLNPVWDLYLKMKVRSPERHQFVTKEITKTLETNEYPLNDFFYIKLSPRRHLTLQIKIIHNEQSLCSGVVCIDTEEMANPCAIVAFSKGESQIGTVSISWEVLPKDSVIVKREMSGIKEMIQAVQHKIHDLTSKLRYYNKRLTSLQMNLLLEDPGNSNYYHSSEHYDTFQVDQYKERGEEKQLGLGLGDSSSANEEPPGYVHSTELYSLPAEPSVTDLPNGAYITSIPAQDTHMPSDSDEGLVEDERVDWSFKFQKYLKSMDTSTKFQNLASLAKNFSFIAETYGRIIISEQFLSKKMISPASVGGVAGGEKYICQNILFKFAKDVYLHNAGLWVYGRSCENTEKAMKAAGNELKGLGAFYHLQLPDLHFPLMAIIHYKGFCMSASSVLPISDETLIYGSGDGGRNVQFSEAVHSIMETAGNLLNLKKHFVAETGIPIIGPGDIEIHRGHDNQLYVVDLGRLMPPEYPLKNIGNPFFYNLLRPICVQNWSQPLCSDTFSKWDNISEREDHIKQIYTLSQNLPLDKFIRSIMKHYSDYSNLFESKLEELHIFDEDKFIKSLHNSGLNCRHLGLVRRRLLYLYGESKSKPIILKFASLCLTECVVRTIKNELRVRFREVMEKEKILTETPYINIIYQYLRNKLYWEFHPSEMIFYKNKSIPNIKSFKDYGVANFPMQIESQAFYMEVHLTEGFSMMLGLAKKDSSDSLVVLHEYWSSGIIRHLDIPYESTDSWKPGDVIGLFLYSTKNTWKLEMIVNGNIQPKCSYIFNEAPPPLFPVTIFDDKTTLKVNFGDYPFSFDIFSYCRKLKLNVNWKKAQEAKFFWTKEIKEQMKFRFPKSLTKEEKQANTDVRSLIDKALFFHYLPKYCGIEFSNNLSRVESGKAELQVEEIITLRSRTIKMVTIDYAEALNVLLHFEENPSLYDTNQLLTTEQQLSYVLKQSKVKHARDYYYWGSLCFALFKNNQVPYLSKAYKLLSSIKIDSHQAWEDNYKLWFSKGLSEVKCKIFFKLGQILSHKFPQNPEKAQKLFSKAVQMSSNIIDQYFAEVLKIYYSTLDPNYLSLSFIEIKTQWKICKQSKRETTKFIELLLHYIEIQSSSQPIETLISEVAPLLYNKKRSPILLKSWTHFFKNKNLSDFQLLIILKIRNSVSELSSLLDESISSQKIVISHCTEGTRELIMREIAEYPLLNNIISQILKAWKSHTIPKSQLTQKEGFQGLLTGPDGNIDVILLPYPEFYGVDSFFKIMSHLKSKSILQQNIEVLGICYELRVFVFKYYRNTMKSSKNAQTAVFPGSSLIQFLKSECPNLHETEKQNFIKYELQRRLSILQEIAQLCARFHQHDLLLVDLFLKDILVDEGRVPIIFHLLFVQMNVDCFPVKENLFNYLNLKGALPPEAAKIRSSKKPLVSSWDVYLFGKLCESVLNLNVIPLPAHLKNLIVRCFSDNPNHRPGIRELLEPQNVFDEAIEFLKSIKKIPKKQQDTILKLQVEYSEFSETDPDSNFRLLKNKVPFLKDKPLDRLPSEITVNHRQFSLTPQHWVLHGHKNGPHAYYKKLLPGKNSYKRLETMWQALDGRDYHIEEAFAIHNPDLLSNFAIKHSLLSGQTRTNSKDWEYAKDKYGTKRWIMENYYQLVSSYSWNDHLDVPILPAITESILEVAETTIKTGLYPIESRQCGKGIYFIGSAEQGITFQSNPTVIISLVITGNVYPSNEHPNSKYSLKNGPLLRGYNSHFALIRRDGLPCHKIFSLKEEPYYYEIMVDHPSSVLPIYLLKLSISKEAFEEKIRIQQEEQQKLQIADEGMKHKKK